MLTNYLKIALRHLLRQKFYTAVTLLSLTVGLTFLLLIGNYVQGELAVNQSLRNPDRQYLLQSRWKVKEMGYEIASPAPMGPTIRQRYPTLVANYYRHYDVNAIVSAGQHPFRQSIQIGDSTLLPMFGFSLAYGDPQTALRTPNSLVLTLEAAHRFFGRTDVLRRTLTVQTPGAGKQRFTVTGVLQPTPRNTVTNLTGSLPDIFMPMSDIGYFTDKTQMQSWDNRTIVTHLELQPHVTASQLDQPLAQIIATLTPPATRDNLRPYLSSLSSYYLQADDGLIEKMVITLSLIGFFILLMAVVNFINITIGRSAGRLREIGVRKAIGGLKKQLVAQFLTETLLLVTGATVLALGLHELVRSVFASVLERPIPSVITWSPVAWLGLLVAVFVIGLLAGSYPAFILSALPSVDSLKGKALLSIRKGTGFRRLFITFQFTVAIFVFVGAIVVGRQVTYFFGKDLGYAKEQILTVASVPRDWSPAGVRRMEGVRDQLLRVPGVQAASFSFEIPDGASSGSASVFAQGQDSTAAITANTVTTDAPFARTYGLTLRAGTYFSEQSQDSASVMLNESAVKALGWRQPEQAIDQQVRFWGTSFRVRGVLADFHFGSLHEAIKPLVFVSVSANPIYRYVTFRLTPTSLGDLSATVAAINREWSRLLPDAPFEYTFMDDTLQKLYQSELQLKRAATLATVLALFIVLLGVLGLVSLNVTRRTKEIGIRKTLGASAVSIIRLFLREFVGMLVVANLVAWPLAYYLLQHWLTRFVYRTPLSWEPFVLVAFTLALFTSLVVGVQTIKAALMNPVNSLRSE